MAQNAAPKKEAKEVAQKKAEMLELKKELSHLVSQQEAFRRTTKQQVEMLKAKLSTQMAVQNEKFVALEQAKKKLLQEAREIDATSRTQDKEILEKTFERIKKELDAIHEKQKQCREKIEKEVLRANQHEMDFTIKQNKLDRLVAAAEKRLRDLGEDPSAIMQSDTEPKAAGPRNRPEGHVEHGTLYDAGQPDRGPRSDGSRNRPEEYAGTVHIHRAGPTLIAEGHAVPDRHPPRNRPDAGPKTDMRISEPKVGVVHGKVHVLQDVTETVITPKRPKADTGAGRRKLTVSGYYYEPSQPSGSTGSMLVDNYILMPSGFGLLENRPEIAKFVKEEFPEYSEWFENTIPKKNNMSPTVSPKSWEFFERFYHVLMVKKSGSKCFEIEKNILKYDIQAMFISKDLSNITDPGERKADIEALRKVLGDLFEWRQKRRQLEAEAIAKELEKIQSFLKKREEHKDEIIQRRLDQLTGDKTLEW
ncbi:MAG: hypothetical protein PVH19_11085 [Planctomycetia bacterium]